MSDDGDRPDGTQGAREPILNVPPFTAIVAGLLLAVHVLRQALDPAQDEWLLLNFGVFSTHWRDGPGLLDVVALVTHMFLHASWLHLIVNAAMLVAFGSGVERLLGGVRMLTVLVLGGIAGAILNVLFYLDEPSLGFGASGGVSALFGLTVFAMAMRGGGWRRLILITVFWLGFNLAFGLFGSPEEGLNIAWIGHMGGYFTGLLYGYWLMRRPIGRRQ